METAVNEGINEASPLTLTRKTRIKDGLTRRHEDTKKNSQVPLFFVALWLRVKIGF
jgi:hypothetical protein